MEIPMADVFDEVKHLGFSPKKAIRLYAGPVNARRTLPLISVFISITSMFFFKATVEGKYRKEEALQCFNYQGERAAALTHKPAIPPQTRLHQHQRNAKMCRLRSQILAIGSSVQLTRLPVTPGARSHSTGRRVTSAKAGRTVDTCTVAHGLRMGTTATTNSSALTTASSCPARHVSRPTASRRPTPRRLKSETNSTPVPSAGICIIRRRRLHASL